jgi:dATP pyrophosphohydrolase
MGKHKGVPIRTSAICAFVCRSVDDQWQVLLLYRNEEKEPGGFWCQVAGGMEGHETAWQAALREIEEETGLVPERLYATDRCEQFYNARDEAVVINPVFLAIVDPRDGVVLDDEHTDHAWLSPEAARERLPFYGQRDLLQYVVEKFLEGEPNEMLRIVPHP